MTRRPWLAALLVAASVLAWAAPSRAQTATPRIRLVVTELTGIVGPGVRSAEGEAAEDAESDVNLRLLVENRGPNDVDGLRVVVETWPRIDTRSEMRVALDGPAIPGDATSTRDLPVRDDGVLAAGDIAGIAITIPSERMGFDADAASVHPLQVSLVRGTTVIDQARTAIVHLPAAPSEPLETAIVWPLTERPWRGPDGVYTGGVDASIQPGGRLERLLRPLEQHPDIPVTIAPAAHLLEDLRDRADGFPALVTVDGAAQIVDLGPDDPAATAANGFLRRVREVVAGTPIPPVTGAYADVVLEGLTGRGPDLAELAGTAVVDGRQRLRALLDRRPDQGTFLATSPLDDEALDLISADHLLLPYELVVGPDLDTNPNVDIPYAQRRLVTPSGRPVVVTVADPWVTALVADLDGVHGAELAAHRVVVETAMLQLRRPGDAGRPLLVLPPLDWDPPGRTAEELLTALAAAPWLRLTDPGTLVAAADREPGGVRLREGLGETFVQRLTADLVQAERSLDAARAALPDEAAVIDGRPRAELEQQLLRAPSAWLVAEEPEEAKALIRDVRGAVDRSFGEVEVPATARVTLTSERGTIPVTLRREGGPLTVRVTVDSQGGLAWPDGRTSPDVTLAEDGTQTVSFPTQALSRGTFAVTVTVTDPTGTRVLETTRLSVRSTAISRPALIVTGAIVALLLLRGVWRRRPPDRPSLEVVR